MKELPPPPGAELCAEYRLTYRRHDRPEPCVLTDFRNEHSAGHVARQIAANAGTVSAVVVERRLISPWRPWRVIETAPTTKPRAEPQSEP